MAILRPPVRRHRNDFSIHLTADQSELLLRLLDEMAAMLSAEMNDSGDNPDSDKPDSDNRERLARLFPPAYSSATPDEQLNEREAEYQRLMRDELVQSRLASIATVRECLENPRHLSEPQLIGFLQAVNALRLVLGTILKITDDVEDPDASDEITWIDDPRSDDPNFGLQVAYQFLSWVLDWTVQALNP